MTHSRLRDLSPQCTMRSEEVLAVQGWKQENALEWPPPSCFPSPSRLLLSCGLQRRGLAGTGSSDGWGFRSEALPACPILSLARECRSTGWMAWRRTLWSFAQFSSEQKFSSELCSLFCLLSESSDYAGELGAGSPGRPGRLLASNWGAGTDARLWISN